MPAAERRLITNQAVSLLSLAIVAVGIALMVGVRKWLDVGTAPYGVLDAIGSLLIATGFITFAWDLVAKRALISEVMATARLAEEVTKTGIVGSYTRFPDLPWDELFEGTESLDALFLWAHTWRNSHGARLEKLAAKKKWDIRIFLPDPDHEGIVNEIARRTDYKAADVISKVKESEAAFRSLFKNVDGDRRRLTIYFYNRTPMYSFYRFSQASVLALYKFRQGRAGDVPALVVGAAGDFYAFVDGEIDNLISDKKLTREAPAPAAAGGGN